MGVGHVTPDSFSDGGAHPEPAVAGAHASTAVTAAADPAMAGLAARTGAGLVLMHMQGTPRTMQDDPRYDDVARDVARWLEQRVAVVRRAGVDAEQIALDPGIGFGKTLVHNPELV